MPEQAPTTIDRTVLLEQYIAEIRCLAQAQQPEAVVEVLSIRCEDEDAHILIFLPAGTSETDLERLGATLTSRSVEILLDTGLLILAGVYEASSRR